MAAGAGSPAASARAASASLIIPGAMRADSSRASSMPVPWFADTGSTCSAPRAKNSVFSRAMPGLSALLTSTMWCFFRRRMCRYNSRS